MRMEEILQLGPDDFGSDKGIPYLRIRHTVINGVKTLSSAWTLPRNAQPRPAPTGGRGGDDRLQPF